MTNTLSKLLGSASSGSSSLMTAAIANVLAMQQQQQQQQQQAAVASELVPPSVEGGMSPPGMAPDGPDSQKKTCPYCYQQLSWHALSRHIRDMHRAKTGLVTCEFCNKTFRNKNSLGCHKWRFHKDSREGASSSAAGGGKDTSGMQPLNAPPPPPALPPLMAAPLSQDPAEPFNALKMTSTSVNPGSPPELPVFPHLAAKPIDASALSAAVMKDD